jgi:glycosyltransferase involved in cell wall biosynthesis
MSPDSQPLVTIGISTFNRVDGTFPEALRTALAQTMSDLEILVCDNASEDGTEAFMARQDDPRLRYHRHPTNIGANANFQSCLDLARGRYFLLLHDDDRLDPSFVERAMEARGDREAGVILGAAQVIDAAGRVTSTTPPPPRDLDAADLMLAWFGRSMSFYFCSTIFHAERLRELGGFRSPHGLFQDVVAIAQLAARHGYVSVPGVAGSFRRHADNRGGGSEALHWAEDSLHLLDTICEELPERAAELRAVGAPYLTQKCYRYVESVTPTRLRWRLYGEVHRLLGRSYAPWRYVAMRRRVDARHLIGRSLRAAGVLPRRSAQGS